MLHLPLLLLLLPLLLLPLPLPLLPLLLLLLLLLLILLLLLPLPLLLLLLLLLLPSSRRPGTATAGCCRCCRYCRHRSRSHCVTAHGRFPFSCRTHGCCLCVGVGRCRLCGLSARLLVRRCRKMSHGRVSRDRAGTWQRWDALRPSAPPLHRGRSRSWQGLGPGTGGTCAPGSPSCARRRPAGQKTDVSQDPR